MVMVMSTKLTTKFFDDHAAWGEEEYMQTIQQQVI
jgi:hypothetical protein